MAQYIDKSALVAEIKRLESEIGDDEYWHGYDVALFEISYFINSMEEEPAQCTGIGEPKEELGVLGKMIKEMEEESVSEELEKAAVNAFKQIVDSDKNNFLEIFKAGANWQKQKMMKDAT